MVVSVSSLFEWLFLDPCVLDWTATVERVLQIVYAARLLEWTVFQFAYRDEEYFSYNIAHLGLPFTGGTKDVPIYTILYSEYKDIKCECREFLVPFHLVRCCRCHMSLLII